MVQGTKVKDPRWLRIDICRDFAAGKCKRKESECRFAHPRKECIVENRKLTVCYDSLKGKCTRETCKFYHPPFHIKEYLLAFGKALEQQRLEQERQEFQDSMGQHIDEKSTRFERSYQRSDSEPINGTNTQNGDVQIRNIGLIDQPATFMLGNPVDPIYVTNSGFANHISPVQIPLCTYPQPSTVNPCIHQTQFPMRSSISFPHHQTQFTSCVPVNGGFDQINLPMNSFGVPGTLAYQHSVPQTILVPIWRPVYNQSTVHMGQGEPVPTQQCPALPLRAYRPNSI